MSINRKTHIKYNIMALLVAIVGMANYILQLNILGVSEESDVLAISSFVVISLQMITLVTIEQFIVFYMDLKNQNQASAELFFNVVLTRLLVFMVFFSIICVISKSFLLQMFAGSIDGNRLKLLEKVIVIYILNSVLFPIITLFNMLLNAESRFAYPYVVSIIQALSITFTYVYMHITNSRNIILIPLSMLLSGIISIILLCFKLSSLNIRFRIRWMHLSYSDFLFQSIFMRTAHNVNNFLIQPVIGSVVSVLPVGEASSYNYSRKMIDIIQSVVLGPIFSILRTRIIEAWSAGHKHEIRKYIKSYAFYASLMISLCAILGWLLLPFVFNIILPNKISSERINVIRNVFLLLSFWILIGSIESPYVLVLTINRKVTIFYVVNISNIIIIIISLKLLASYNIYSIPMAIIVGQVINFVAYSFVGRKLLK